MILDIQLTDQANKQVKIQLAMAGAFILMFMPLLIDLARAVTSSPQPAGNRLFGVLATCFVALLVLLVGWKSFLLAVHVKRASEMDGVVVMKRILAPEVRVSSSSELRSFSSVVPSLSAPYYKRGTVFCSGMLVFYISDYLPGAQLLVDRLLLDQRA
jgi:hypothetical protein